MSDGNLQSDGETFSALGSALAELYERSRGSEYGLESTEFAGILHEIARKQVAPNASKADIAAFCSSLRVEELALAQACALGREKAWEVFLLRYREKLYEVAIYITKEKSAARELADSLYAESLWHYHSRRATDFEARLLHWARISGGLVAYGVGPGARESISPRAAVGEPGRGE